jgi:hypothetical protein
MPVQSHFQVDGSLSAWMWIVSPLCTQPAQQERERAQALPLEMPAARRRAVALQQQAQQAPALTLGGAYTLLPVAHKYSFPKLITKLVDFVKGQALLSDPQHPSKYITSWLTCCSTSSTSWLTCCSTS